MKYLFNFGLGVLLLGLIYGNIRQAAWSELVAANYMIGLYARQECIKDVILKNRIPILERVLKLPGVDMNPGVLDTTTCDAMDAQWKKYEADRERYNKIKWLYLNTLFF